MARNYAALKHEYLEEMDILTDEEFGRLCRALLAYSRDGTPIELTGMERAYAKRVMKQEDQFQESYEQACATRRENGKKGGRPKKNQPVNSENQENQPVSEKPNGFEENQMVSEETEKTKSKSKSKSNISSSEDIDVHAQESSPKVQWAEFVSMTNAEHDKLVSTYGAVDTARMIEILDNYKGQNGKKYKSDYRAILNWVVGRLIEEKGKGVNTYGSSSASESTGFSDDPWGDLPFG